MPVPRGPRQDYEHVLPPYQRARNERDTDAAPPALTVRMVPSSPTSLQLITGQTLTPGATVTVTPEHWAALTPEVRAATHRLLTDPKWQQALLGGRYISEVPTTQEISR